MKSQHKILYVFGTRPEVIKLAPLISLSKNIPETEVQICSTGQHKEMLAPMLDFFDIHPDYNFDVMEQNQTLSSVASKIMTKLDMLFREARHDLVIVQGDTASAYAAALTAYHHQIPLAHVEAGLRSGDKYAPFPEEGYRRMISTLAEYHFAPTEKARNNLQKEGIIRNVWVTGNTVVDALLSVKDKVLFGEKNLEYEKKFDFAKTGNKIILVTGHRRESFGGPLLEICDSLADISRKNKDVEIVYPVHLNPEVKKIVKEKLGTEERIHLIPPLDYPALVWLMERSYFIITDSGGIQEEAPSLKKPVLVTRSVTERTEGIEAGCAVLVGFHKKKISEMSEKLLRDSRVYQKMSDTPNPYGDGKSAGRIVTVLKDILHT
ncbi:MAG: UDP-N-acetylglucosamine 2-epimerase (non-hydrolyzing) [Parcubacteria group bacterium]|nr:UDP-N-acetylglucosamine 2-epimerase (non-hydrolyzing) [Parcubacteria group bacterium]